MSKELAEDYYESEFERRMFELQEKDYYYFGQLWEEQNDDDKK